jgi:methylenetetrahydrofolate reductase (NADPH)
VGGVHKSFSTLAEILDRLEKIEHQWHEFIPEFDFPQEKGFYVYKKDYKTGLSKSSERNLQTSRAQGWEKVISTFMRKMHDIFFDFESPWNLCVKNSAP